MSKILILPDVHNRWETAEKIIQSVKPDQTIFLGDYFDDFGDDPIIISEVADWFHHSINQENRIHICGNHDVHYWFPGNRSVRCSGYEQFKSIAINDIVTKSDWEKLIFFYNLDNKWLLTHAGVHPSWIDRQKFTKNEIIDHSITEACQKLKHNSIEAKKSFYKDKDHWFGMPGFSRCQGSPFYGGILWCDWVEEFFPIRGLHQIVGHTPNYNITWKIINEGEDKMATIPLDGVSNPALKDTNSYNICLDSHPGSRYYAIYEDGNLSVHAVDKK